MNSIQLPQQLLQSLQQLSQTSSAAPALKQAVQTQVSILGSQIILNLPKSNNRSEKAQLPGTVKLPLEQLQGQLSSNQLYQVAAHTVKNSPQQNVTILQFFSQPANKPIVLPKTLQEAVLQLSPKEFIPPQAQSRPIAVQAKVVNTTTTSITLALPKAAKVQIPAKAEQPTLKPGQQVQVQMISAGDKWQVKILPQSQTTTPSSNQSVAPIQLKPSANLRPLIEQVAIQLSKTAPDNNTAIAVSKSALQTLTNTPALTAVSKPLLQPLLNSNDTALPLQINPQGQLTLKTTANNSGVQLVAQIPVTTAQLQQLKPLLAVINRGLPQAQPQNQNQIATGQPLQVTDNAQRLQKEAVKTETKMVTSGLNTAATTVQPKTTSTELSTAHIVPKPAKTHLPLVAPAVSKQPQSNPPDGSIPAAITKTQVPQSKLEPQQLARLEQVKPQLTQILRQVQAKAELPGTSLALINAAISDPQLIKDPEIKPLLNQLKQALQIVPQNNPPDVNQLKQLLSLPPLPLSAPQLTVPAPNTGFMEGLITLLQLSLSARMQRSQPTRSELIHNSISTLIGQSAFKPKGTTTSKKGLQELSQSEQKHQLIREIGRLLAGHQSNKIASAEQLLQGQESLYYVLPNAFGSNNKDIELLIRREQDKTENQQKADTDQSVWQLTMKLDIGAWGELLSKAKLQDSSVDLNLYTSTPTLKDRVLELLPFLHKRLTSLGLEIGKSHCQLGVIPVTLNDRPYHIFQTQA